ncbi:MAG: adenylosuccinate lyase [Candidatus Bipolaricaulota bacterium]|nr:adenylosuccinate lyase [Candidatus Bipolaricaulota bacterium]MCS7274834.1 adenylosuccinate lyase [Candidatus Bipolaricaulota bacterium]MDW8111255.1 adenylosuccinate lyase [Candidatus Bipolaricaulota bacterium]MDW8328609.1 adenylosuccinate lyase [Candidatus Bipolaricaulota bacterium]
MIERYSLSPMKELWTEEAKYRRWLQVELAVAEAQAELGYIPQEAARAIRQKVRLHIARAKEIESQIGHDLLAFVRSLEESVGPEGRYIHRGLTSYDVEDTALGLAFKEALAILIEDANKLAAVLWRRALEHKRTLMVGRTHGMHAEPITFGLKLLVWYDEMQRHLQRLKDAQKLMSVGKISGSVGTYANVDPEVERRVCAKLGLAPVPISNQIVQRDRHAQVLTTLAICAGTVEKIATEIRNLHRTEIAEVREGRPHGSSSMPHKQNPSTCETLTGLARLVRVNALAALENQTIWHEQDLTRSSVERVIIPDSFLATHYLLVKLTDVIEHLVVNAERMRQNLELSLGTVFSQALLLKLVDKGMARAQAHELVSDLAHRAMTEQKSFQALVGAHPEIQKLLSPDEIDQLFDDEYHLKHVETIFARFV